MYITIVIKRHLIKRPHCCRVSPSAVLWQAESARLSLPPPLRLQAALLLQPLQRLLLLQVS